MRGVAVVVLGSSLVVGHPALAQEVLRREPPRGELRTGTTVLVDDGSCPRGQIKEVTGGSLGAADSRRGGGGGAGMARQRRCIPR